MLKEIVSKSYFHLLIIFVIVVFLFEMQILPPYMLNFVLFAFILGGFGFALKQKAKPKVPVYLLYVAMVFVLVTRIIPYIGNDVPLGYDPGLYKYIFEHPFGENWIKTAYPMLFTAVMGGLNKIFGSWFLLVPLFIFLSAGTGFVIYHAVSKLYNKEAGIIAAMLFAVSLAQFQAYWFNYYKNIFGIILLLLSFLYFENRKMLILFGAMIAGTHRPAFFLFGATYFVYSIVSYKLKSKQFKAALVNCGIMFLLGMLVNFDRIQQFFLSGLFSVTSSFIEMSGGSGTFFDSSTYFYYALPFIPFAVTGFLFYWKDKLQISIAMLITVIMVVLKLFFHNRFIIYMDVFVIIFAGLGFIALLRSNKAGYFVLYGFLVMFSVIALKHAIDSQPLISSEEFSEIKSLNEYITDGQVMVTDKYYSPWVKGYVNKPVIAPGLFDENKMTQDQWIEFWRGDHTFINMYELPVYIHVGYHQSQYSGKCFIPVYLGKTKLYQYNETCN